MKIFATLIAIALLSTHITGSFAGDGFTDNRSILAGKQILQNSCASCHAISLRDNNQHPDALEFRFLSRQYPVEMLAEALVEGIMSGHPDMPVFEFNTQQVDQIIAYLKSIQVQP